MQFLDWRQLLLYWVLQIAHSWLLFRRSSCRLGPLLWLDFKALCVGNSQLLYGLVVLLHLLMNQLSFIVSLLCFFLFLLLNLHNASHDNVLLLVSEFSNELLLLLFSFLVLLIILRLILLLVLHDLLIIHWLLVEVSDLFQSLLLHLQ